MLYALRERGRAKERDAGDERREEKNERSRWHGRLLFSLVSFLSRFFSLYLDAFSDL
jgi:hypothetical protein